MPYRDYRERFTAQTTDTVTLAHTPLITGGGQGREHVYLNGLHLSPGDDYTIAGTIITFNGNLVASDVVVVTYPYAT